MKKFLFPTILIILSIGLFVMYVDPVYKEIKELRKVSAKYDEALDKSKELKKVRDSLLVTYNSFSQNDLSRLRKMLPDNVDNVRLIMDINGIAAKYGTIIKDIKLNSSAGKSPTNVAGVEEYGSVNLGFSVMATYDDFLKFLEDLRDSLRLVDVVALGFSSVEDDVSIYKFNVEIKTYWLK